jgi:DNA-binding IclR family transcriptional regulator
LFGKESGVAEARGVQSIEVGGRLLAAMVQLGQPAMLRDIAAAAQMTPAQSHAYLVSFRKIGLVDQDATTGRYQLGAFALQLGLARMHSFDPLRRAASLTAELAAELGLMVTTSVWGTHGPTVIQVQEAVQTVHVNLRAGTVYTITGTATGQLFAAYMPAPVLQPLLRQELRSVSRSARVGLPTNQAALAEAVADIRRRGYAITRGVPVPGVNAVCVPVFDHDGHLQYGVTVIGYDTSLDLEPDSPQVNRALSFAREASEQLGWRPA